MKLMCRGYKNAELMCINCNCEEKCSYMCGDSKDVCREDHECCSMINLQYIIKMSDKILGKSKSIRLPQLKPIIQAGDSIVTQIKSYTQKQKKINQIREILQYGQTNLSTKDKQFIFNFINEKNSTQNQLNSNKIQKQLINLNILIGEYLNGIEKHKNELKEQQMMQPNRKTSPSKINTVKSGIRESLFHSTKKSTLKKNQEDFKSKVASIIKKHVSKEPLFSKITNDIETLQTLFYEKFTKSTLLYRASENDFLVSKFHKLCDGHRNTLTLILTQYQKVIGGFTQLPWRSGGGQWYCDEKCTSFLFNLTLSERYPLKIKDKAIWCSHAYGPSFGHPDLEIADKAIHNQNSCANFPQCYNNGNYNSGSGSTQLFCGSKNGHFKIIEWQVYEIQF